MKDAHQVHDPESLSIAALSWIAGDPAMLRRFLDLTGIEATEIRSAAAQPGFLAGVLKFIAAHEPTLNVFAEAENVHPSSIMKAIRALPGGSDDWMGST